MRWVLVVMLRLVLVEESLGGRRLWDRTQRRWWATIQAVSSMNLSGSNSTSSAAIVSGGRDRMRWRKWGGRGKAPAGLLLTHLTATRTIFMDKSPIASRAHHPQVVVLRRAPQRIVLFSPKFY